MTTSKAVLSAYAKGGQVFVGQNVKAGNNTPSAGVCYNECPQWLDADLTALQNVTGFHHIYKGPAQLYANVEHARLEFGSHLGVCQ